MKNGKNNASSPTPVQQPPSMSASPSLVDTQQEPSLPTTATQPPMKQPQLPPEKKPKSIIKIVIISIVVAIGLFFAAAVVYGVFMGVDDAVTEINKEDQEKARSAQDATGNNETAFDEANKDQYVLIPEWGVSIGVNKLIDKVAIAVFVSEENDDASTIAITVKPEYSSYTDCESRASFTRLKDVSSFDNAPEIKLGEYYYYNSGVSECGGAALSDNPERLSTQTIRDYFRIYGVTDGNTVSSGPHGIFDISPLELSVADPDKRGLLFSSESYKDVTGSNRSVYYVTTLGNKFEECGRVLQIGELAGPDEYSPPSETESGDKSVQKTIDAKVYFVIKTVGSEIDDSCRGNAEFNTFVADLQAYVLQNMDKSLTQ